MSTGERQKLKLGTLQVFLRWGEGKPIRIYKGNHTYPDEYLNNDQLTISAEGSDGAVNCVVVCDAREFSHYTWSMKS